jgi:hypothetical protein
MNDLMARAAIVATAAALVALVLASPAAAVTYTLAIEPNEFDAYPGEVGAASSPTPAQVIVTEDGGPVSADTFVAISSSDGSKLTVDGGGVTVPTGSTTAVIQYTAFATGQTTLTATLGATPDATATADVISPLAPKMSVTPFKTTNKPVGTMQDLTANFSLAGGITPARVRWTVSGANNVGPTEVTDNSPNTSLFSYMGANAGTDTVTACYDPNNDNVCDNVKHATVTWATPTATASPGTLNFGSQPIGTQSSSQPVTLANTGTVPLSVGAATILGPGAAQFTMTADGCSNTTVPVADDCTVAVAMAPTALGIFAAHLRIPDDSSTGPHDVALNGAGVRSSPTLSTTASSNVDLGHTVHDTATLASGNNPTGQITFRLYGPHQSDCSQTPVFQTSKAVAGNAAYTSASFTASKGGLYRWIATYSGDANNKPAKGSCGAAGESVTIRKATPKLTTTASASVVLGGKVHDTARLSAGYNPTGKLSFDLFRAGDTNCVQAILFSDTKSVSGNRAYRSADFTPRSIGTYRWEAVYSGDANNKRVVGPCNAPNESVTVTAP